MNGKTSRQIIGRQNKPPGKAEQHTPVHPTSAEREELLANASSVSVDEQAAHGAYLFFESAVAEPKAESEGRLRRRQRHERDSSCRYRSSNSPRSSRKTK